MRPSVPRAPSSACATQDALLHPSILPPVLPEAPLHDFSSVSPFFSWASGGGQAQWQPAQLGISNWWLGEKGWGQVASGELPVPDNLPLSDGHPEAPWNSLWDTKT